MTTARGIWYKPPAMRTNRRPVWRSAAVVAPCLLSAGCDPVLNIYGSFFPAWVVSLVLGMLLTIPFRLLFALTRIERHLGTLIVVYPSLAFLLTCLTWLALYRG